MVVFINSSSSIGAIYNAINYNITGSEFLTLLGIVIMVMLFFMLFRLPVEASAILVLPVLITFMAFNNNLFAIGGVFLIYAGLLIAKNWIVQ